MRYILMPFEVIFFFFVTMIFMILEPFVKDAPEDREV